MVKVKKPKVRNIVQFPTAAQLPTECCLACRFYLLPDSVCRAMPPQVIPAGVNPQGEPQWRSVFPPMQAGGWCGSFSKRPDPKSEELP